MTVAELIEELSKLPPDAEVILQKDAEGNGYGPLEDVDGNCIYQDESSVISADWTAEEACFDSDEAWEAYKSYHPRCCVLAP